MNPIIEYWKWINRNKQNRGRTPQKIHKVYAELARLLDDPESEWEYDPAKADHALDFIENYCRHSKGKMAGKPFRMELWQKALVAATFGIVHKIDGTRKYQEVVLMVARKNGKSTMAAAIGLYLMIADGEPGAEIYACATKRDQAKIIWLEARRMVKKSPALSRRIKTLVAEINSDYNDSFFKPLGRDSDTLDGLNVQGALLDEIHAWQDQNLYDVIVDGTSSREQPLVLVTTTAGTIREQVFDLKYDECEMVINGYGDPEGYKNERLLPIIYELDNRKDWTNPEAWYQANPGLGTIKQLDQLENKVAKAKANPKLVKNLLCKDFNIRETNSEAWLTFEQLNNMETFDLAELKPRYGIAGIDLSSTTDLTCASVIFHVPDDDTLYVKQMYWLPQERLEQRIAEDRIPYDTWQAQGYLRTSEGNKVNYKDVTEWLVEVQNDLDVYIYKIGYDSWSSTYLVDELKNNFGAESTDPVIQGAKTFSGPMKRFEADLESKKINYGNNPVLKWNLSNAAITVDRNDNIALVKTSNSRRRIDGVASLLDAYIVLERHYENYMGLI